MTSTIRKKTLLQPLFAAVEAGGFERQARKAVGFYDFARTAHDRDEWVTVQMDKNGRPKFTIEFGVGRLFSRDDGFMYRLYSSALIPFWFRSRNPKSVARAVENFPEILGWFEDGKIRRHIRRARII